MAHSKPGDNSQQCDSERQSRLSKRREYYQRNREKILKKISEKRRQNIHAAKEREKRNRLKYREKRNARNREYMREARIADPQKFRIRARISALKNPEAARARSARYYAKNKKKAYLATKRCWDRKRKEDPSALICCRLRNRVRKALAAQGASKSEKTMALIGCSVAALVRHIESQFLAGMSWDNRKLWHVDHIIPLAAFDLTQKEQQFAAFHYTNMRPLWAKENQKKSARPPEPQRMFGFAYAARIADGVKSSKKRGRPKDA